MSATVRQEGIQVNRKRFEGKVALVTGAGSPRGIGRATALALAREGAKVTITDIVADNVKRVVSELTEISQAIGEVADVRNKDQMVQVVKRATEALGGLDILVNVAGLTRPTLFLDISEEEYDLVLDVNLKGTFLTTQAAVPAMLGRGGGTIVSLSSVSGQRGGGVFGTSAYSAAKAGIMGLTKALARELTPRGIRVNCVAPSMVDTDIAGDLLTPERKVELATGTQTVHDIELLTTWDRQTLAEALQNEPRLFYLLTNSRSMPESEAVQLNHETAQKLAAASEETKIGFVVASRSDSTLRGHYPAEIQALESGFTSSGGDSFDGHLVCRLLLEKKKYTINNTHYVATLNATSY